MNPEAEAKPVVAVQPVQNNTVDKENTQEAVQERNWKAFREEREIERKRSEEMAKQARKSQEEAAALKAALDAVLNKNQPQASNNRDEEQEETEEQRIDRRVNAAIAIREAEAEKRRREQEEQEYPQKINREYKDFQQVCSTENLDYLDYHYPEVAAAFSHMPQGYEKWAAIYKAVKRFVPNPDSKKEQSKAEKNFNKPQSISGSSTTNSGDTTPGFHLTDKKKAENYARMQKIMNRVS